MCDVHRPTLTHITPEVVPPALAIAERDALSGRAQRKLNLGQEGCGTCGVLGTERNGRVELVILQGWYASDTLEIFTGELRGDSLVGSYRGLGGRARFVRER